MGDLVIFFGKNLFSTPNLLWSKVIAILGVYAQLYKPINSMQDFRLFHSCTVQITPPLKGLWISYKVNWLVDYKFIAWFKLQCRNQTKRPTEAGGSC